MIPGVIHPYQALNLTEEPRSSIALVLYHSSSPVTCPFSAGYAPKCSADVLRYASGGDQRIRRVPLHGSKGAIRSESLCLGVPFTPFIEPKSNFPHTYIMKTARIFQLIKLMQENHLIASYLNIVYVSSRQFIPIYAIDTPLASLFLLVRNLSPNTYLAAHVDVQPSDAEEHHSSPIDHISQELRFYSLSAVNRLLLIKITDFPAVALFNFRRLFIFNSMGRPSTPTFPSYSPPNECPRCHRSSFGTLCASRSSYDQFPSCTDIQLPRVDASCLLQFLILQRGRNLYPLPSTIEATLCLPIRLEDDNDPGQISCRSQPPGRTRSVDEFI